jgi:hypothetical protein
MFGWAAIMYGIITVIITVMVTGAHHHAMGTGGLMAIGKITGVAGIGYPAVGAGNGNIKMVLVFGILI